MTTRLTWRNVVDWALLAAFLMPATAGMVLYGGVRFWMSGPLMMVVFAAAAVILLRAAIAPPASPVVKIPPAGLAVIVPLAFGTIMIGPAAVPYEAKLEALRLCSYIVAYWAICALTSVTGRWRALLAVPLLTGSLLCWYAIIQHAHGSTMVLALERPEQYGLRASATYICPNHFANILQILIVIATATALLPRAGWALRIVSVYTMALCFPVLLMTASRSAWIGTAIGLAVYRLALASRKGIKHVAVTAIAIPIAIAAAGLLLWTFSSTFQERVNNALQGNMRVQLWQDTWHAIQEEPVWGHGPGSFRWIYPRYKNVYDDPVGLPRYAHNEYLHTLTEYGAVGAGILGLALLVAVWRMTPLVRRTPSNTVAGVLAGVLGCVAGSMAHAFFDFNLHLFANVHLLILLAAMVSGMLYVSGDLRPRAIPRAPYRVAAALGAVCAAALVAVVGQMLCGYLWTQRAEMQRDALDYDTALASVDRALRIDDTYWKAHKERANILKSKSFWNPDPDEKMAQAEGAAASYRRARERNPYDLHGTLELSKLEGDVFGRQEESLRLLQETVDLAPGMFYYHAQLGLRLRRLGREDEALAVFLRAQELNPKDEMIRLNIRRLQKNASARDRQGRRPPGPARGIDRVAARSGAR